MLTKIENDFLLFHVVFSCLCMTVLMVPAEFQLGPKMFVLVVIYNVTLPLFGVWKKYNDWVCLWLFSFILSLFQVWPDWFLASQLDILVFPEDGLFKIGAVSGYMAGLWTIPLFLIVFVGQRFDARYSRSTAYVAVIVTSFLVFGISEQTSWMLPLWYAKNVITIGHGAAYIILPEIILGVSTYFCYEMIKDKNTWIKIPASFIVMQLYIGSSVFFYFLIETVLNK